jgi:hypothetical protein
LLQLGFVAIFVINFSHLLKLILFLIAKQLAPSKGGKDQIPTVAFQIHKLGISDVLFANNVIYSDLPYTNFFFFFRMRGGAVL